MNSSIKLIILFFALGLLTPYAYAADAETTKTYNACVKEAEADEDEAENAHSFIKGCMVGSGVSAADAEAILKELGPAVEKNDKKDGG